MTPRPELTLQAIRHPRGWLMLGLTVPLLPRTPWRLDLTLNTGRPQSVISPRTRDALLAFGALRHRAGPAYVLQEAQEVWRPCMSRPRRFPACKR